MACSRDLLGETRPTESHVVGRPGSVLRAVWRRGGPAARASTSVPRAPSAAEGAITAVAAKPASARWVSLYPESAMASVVLRRQHLEVALGRGPGPAPGGGPTAP